jgi:hypothetical protein
MCRLNPKGLQIRGLRVNYDLLRSTQQMSAIGIFGQLGNGGFGPGYGLLGLEGGSAKKRRA